MHFDSALNLVWLLFGAFALTASARRCRWNVPGACLRNWFHIAGTVAIVAALFPYISATDDVVRIEHCRSQHESQSTSTKSTHTDNLVRLYETMECSVVSSAVTVTFTPVFVCLTEPSPEHLRTIAAPRPAGRSPPSFLSA